MLRSKLPHFLAYGDPVSASLHWSTGTGSGVYVTSLHAARLTMILVSSAIIATGLVALVDDCICRRWHANHSRRSWILPLPTRSSFSSFSRGLERMGPRRLIGEVLQRRGSA